MIKNHTAWTGVREAAALVNTAIGATIGALWTRQHAIRLRPLEEAPKAGYVWERVFLDKRKEQP